ncbi:MAG: hypothetical protein WDN67_02900 [Candidatus Moraniibacteriota bacterium]
MYSLQQKLVAFSILGSLISHGQSEKSETLPRASHSLYLYNDTPAVVSLVEIVPAGSDKPVLSYSLFLPSQSGRPFWVPKDREKKKRGCDYFLRVQYVDGLSIETKVFNVCRLKEYTLTRKKDRQAKLRPAFESK